MSESCAYPRDTAGEHDHDACTDDGAPLPCTWQRPDGRRCLQPYDHKARCTFPGEGTA